MMSIFNACNNSAVEDKSTEQNVASEGVNAAFYNSDGSKIAISTIKGNLLLTDKHLKLLKSRVAHRGSANSCFFSLNNKFIITGGDDKKLNVWHSDSLGLEKEYLFDFNSYTSVHGYNTLGGCGEKGKLIIYNIKTKDTLQLTLEPEGAYHLYYIKPDTNLVVSSGKSGYEVDLLTKRIAHRYIGHNNLVYCVMPNTRADRIITASEDSTVKIFDRFNEKCLYTSPKLNAAVYVACFNYSDNVVAACTSEGSIYFMDTTLHTIQLKIKAFDGIINTIHFSPDNKTILAGSRQGGAKQFSTANGSLLQQLNYFSPE